MAFDSCALVETVAQLAEVGQHLAGVRRDVAQAERPHMSPRVQVVDREEMRLKDIGIAI